MSDKGSGCLGLIFIIAICYFVYNHYQEKLQSKYEEGYADGYDNGQREPLYPEDITTEYVESDPEQYCGEYIRTELDNYVEHLKENYICYERQ